LKKTPIFVTLSGMDTPRTFTRHFTRDLILVFLALATSVIVAVAYFSAKAQRDISQKYINTGIERSF